MKLSRSRAGRVPLLVIISIAAVVIVTIIGVVVMGGTGPDKVVRQYLVAFQAQDYATLVQLVPKERAEEIEREFQGKYPEPLGNPQMLDLEIGKAEIKGNYARVPVTIKATVRMGYSSNEDTLRMVLVKEGGKWKVDPDATLAASQGPPEGMGAPPMGGGPPGMETMPPGGP